MEGGGLFLQNFTFLPKYHTNFFNIMINSTSSIVKISDFELYNYWKILMIAKSSNVSLSNCYFRSMILQNYTLNFFQLSSTVYSFFNAENIQLFNISAPISSFFFISGNNLNFSLFNWKILNYSLQNHFLVMQLCYYCSIVCKNVVATNFSAINSGFFHFKKNF